MAVKNLTLVNGAGSTDDLETNDALYIESLERAIDNLTDAHGKVTHLLAEAHRELKQERARRTALEVELLNR